MSNRELVVRGTLHAFIAEGATNVWAEAMRGVHEGYGHRVGVLALHGSIQRDGISQEMIGDKNYAWFTEVGIPVEALGRRDEGDGTLPTYTQADLNRIASFAKGADVLTTLEEYPLDALEQVYTDELPPIIANLYRSGAFKPEKHIGKLLIGLKSGAIAKLTVDADASKVAYVKKGVSPGSITVIHNGIDTDRFVPSEIERSRIRKELDIPDIAPTVLLVGRDSSEKDIRLFVRSSRLFLKAAPLGHVIMAGPGLSCENQNIAELIDGILEDEENLRKRFHAVGLRQDLPALYAASDVLSITSVTESRPLCISEAQASGLAVAVSTNVGDAPSMIGKHGFITDRSPEEIAGRWQEAYAKREELGFPIGLRTCLQSHRLASQSVS